MTDINALLDKEIARSKPDYVAFRPRHYDGSTNDSMNEHFLVFEGPDDSLMAVWTQSGRRGDEVEGRGPQINRIMFSRSADDGVTWSPPRRLAGPPEHTEPPWMASWGFPMVSASGRIYVVYNQNQGASGLINMHTGTMAARYSDDCGVTWSAPQDVTMPRSPYDDPDARIPGEWIVWQIPMRDRRGGYLAGYTRWISKARARPGQSNSWTCMESVCEFMRFENIDDNPEPRDFRLRFSAWGDQALRAPHWTDPLLSIAQEPSVVRLPDQRLFCVMRSNSGYVWYALSPDDGETWSNPQPLLRRDHDRPILQPISCCPIYTLADGRYVLLHHNNRGDISRLENTWFPRRPCCIALGEYRPGAFQPIWFSESKVLMDNDGVGADGRSAHGHDRWDDIATYTSFTTRRGNNVLWYPDRKFFLLGKKITPEFLSDMRVP